MTVEPSTNPISSTNECAEEPLRVAPEDLGSFDANTALGEPGSFPFTPSSHGDEGEGFLIRCGVSDLADAKPLARLHRLTARTRPFQG